MPVPLSVVSDQGIGHKPDSSCVLLLPALTISLYRLGIVNSLLSINLDVLTEASHLTLLSSLEFLLHSCSADSIALMQALSSDHSKSSSCPPPLLASYLVCLEILLLYFENIFTMTDRHHLHHCHHDSPNATNSTYSVLLRVFSE